MSDKPDCITETANGNGLKFTSGVTGNLVSGQVHNAGTLTHPKWGALKYEIICANDGLERVDTLYLLNVPISLDSIYFQCELSDPTTGSAPRTSVNDPANPANATQLLIRDSIHGWFATSDPSMRDDHATTDIGASDRTDTVLKCPSTGAILSFYFFGPECNTDQEIIGNKMLVEYQWQDMLGASGTGTYEMTGWQVVTGQTDPVKGRCLYRGTVVVADSITDKIIWVRSVATEAGCLNGSNYPPYDTLYIRDIPKDQKLLAAITDTTLSTGESMVLSNKFSSYALRQPALGSINVSTGTYKAPNTSCSNPAGCSDTIIYTYNIAAADGSTCPMEFQQVVNLSDWYYLKLKVYLEGPYSKSSGLMGSRKGVFSINGSGKYFSPYCSATVLPNLPATSAEISDWIEVSLRKGSDLGHKVDSVSGFLLTNGSVCDLEGKPYLRFKNLLPTSGQDRSYYVVVTHKNHLPVRSNLEYVLKTSESAATLLDLTNASNVYQNNVVLLNNITGLYGLYAGAIVTGELINVSDMNAAIINNGNSGYEDADLDFNWVVNALDLEFVQRNNGTSMSLY